ncbi:DDB1- and CUL4-associated factor 6-like isoform X2 [Cylas formicarius]|uniref:DDB1- and CUL4-associated factor 6-like isoform X2 n=1 Tax=Cylas formicarius TaxID=197179 RepID=UPI00295835C9|nr:DDB1- and CUL4-associated factor 6-like isoform X2 [Cylas formicarius]
MAYKRKSIFADICSRQYGVKINDFATTAKDDPSLIQRLALIKSLQVHQGCVNTLCWNEKGNLILSGSDDQHLVITNAYNYQEVANYSTSHHANIFSAKFLPATNDTQLVSCSGDGVVLHTDLNRPQETYHNQFTCHGGTTTYEVMTIPNDPNTFLSCGEDGTVRWFDLRTKTSCSKQKCKEDILVSCQRAITALTLNPRATYQLAVGCADSGVRIYDRRYLSTQLGAQPFCTFVAPRLDEVRYYRITSLSYDEDGRDILVSYSSDYLYLFNIQENDSIKFKAPAAPVSRKVSPWDKIKAATGKRERLSPPPVRRLRLRGDWSDTGPDARPERDATSTVSIGQARPQLQATLMQRMTDVLSRMLNDPMTRAALSAGGEDSVDPDENAQRMLEAREGGTASLQEGAGGSMETDDGQPSGGSDQEAAVQTSSSEPATPHQESAPEVRAGGGASVTSHLHTHLTVLRNLREGFINQHGAEPSVSFRYSQQSMSNSTISLRVNHNRFGVDGGAASTSGDTGELRPTTEEAPSELMSDVELDYPDYTGCVVSSEPASDKTEEKHSYEAEFKRQYRGHRNARTMIKEATFWGRDHVMSGSDCGHVFIWDRHTAELRMLLQADQHVVNCLRPHPFLPILATSGIDHDVKLWAPQLDECGFDKSLADDLINRNAIMLEETRDTITVPATFMIRMLACLNQIRRGARARNRRSNEDDG